MAETIIETTLHEWIEGDVSPRARVHVFRNIREIPYKVVYRQLDLRKGPRLMLKSREGSCLPKHYLMGTMLGMLGIRIRYCTFMFKWSDLDVEAPEAVMSLGNRIPPTYHLACRALLGERWVLVDATWDSALKKAGFPVNNPWDGMSDTGLAVPAMNETAHESAAECDKWMSERFSEYTLTDKLELSRFCIEFNKWLEKVRNA